MHRDESSAGDASTLVSFSGGTSVQEYDDGATSPSVEYVRGSDYGGGIGGILYTLRSGEPSFNHYNSRGDVVAKTDGNGSLTYQAAYEAFGKHGDTASSQEWGTTEDRQQANTKDEDPTGLLNEGFRYRDLKTGTFITRDPLGMVDGPNLYTYVNQNPWTFFDPRGLKAKDMGGESDDQQRDQSADNTNKENQQSRESSQPEARASEDTKVVDKHLVYAGPGGPAVLTGEGGSFEQAAKNIKNAEVINVPNKQKILADVKEKMDAGVKYPEVTVFSHGGPITEIDPQTGETVTTHAQVVDVAGASTLEGVKAESITSGDTAMLANIVAEGGTLTKAGCQSSADVATQRADSQIAKDKNITIRGNTQDTMYTGGGKSLKAQLHGPGWWSSND